MKYRFYAVLLAATLVLAACEHPFQVHPYDVHVHGDHYINPRNIERIERATLDRDTVRIAFISDTHGWYTEAKAGISNINQRSDIDFVVHLGDLTDTGTTKEFEWSRDILNALHVPYVALIGNHDFLGTGDDAYNYIYGAKDFSFIAGRIKFVCLNTNATEYDFMAAVPNFDFMEEEITKDSARFDRTVVLMHAAPYSDQFNNNVAKAFRRYLDLFPGLICCLYGHNHRLKASAIYNDELMFYGVDSAQHSNYRVFTFIPDGYEEEVVYY